MTFKSAVWYPIAIVLSVINLVGAGFAVGQAETSHATIHAVLALAFGLWAQRLRPGGTERPAQLEGLEATVLGVMVDGNHLPGKAHTQLADPITELLLAVKVRGQHQVARPAVGRAVGSGLGRAMRPAAPPWSPYGRAAGPVGGWVAGSAGGWRAGVDQRLRRPWPQPRRSAARQPTSPTYRSRSRRPRGSRARRAATRPAGSCLTTRPSSRR